MWKKWKAFLRRKTNIQLFVGAISTAIVILGIVLGEEFYNFSNSSIFVAILVVVVIIDCFIMITILLEMANRCE